MPSIRDVANIAGVAVGTVSRVINNSGSVKPDTRRKVEKAIQELNYFPNEVARNFKMRKSKMVALLLTCKHWNWDWKSILIMQQKFKLPFTRLMRWNAWSFAMDWFIGGKWNCSTSLYSKR